MLKSSSAKTHVSSWTWCTLCVEPVVAVVSAAGIVSEKTWSTECALLTSDVVCCVALTHVGADKKFLHLGSQGIDFGNG